VLPFSLVVDSIFQSKKKFKFKFRELSEERNMEKSKIDRNENIEQNKYSVTILKRDEHHLQAFQNKKREELLQKRRNQLREEDEKIGFQLTWIVLMSQWSLMTLLLMNILKWFLMGSLNKKSPRLWK